MPWLRELAHYEWAELALQISEAPREDSAHDARGDPGSSPGQALLAGRPLPSPLAWPLTSAWPVHRIGPDPQPLEPPAQPTLPLLRPESDGNHSFHVLRPLPFRLLDRLEQARSKGRRL